MSGVLGGANDQVRVMWHQGAPVAEIAARFGLSLSVVCAVAARLGWRVRLPVGANDQALFVHLWDGGISRERIGAFFGVSPATVSDWRRRLDLAPRRDGPRIDKARFALMWGAGWPAAAIAREFGVTPGAVRSMARAMGLASGGAAKGFAGASSGIPAEKHRAARPTGIPAIPGGRRGPEVCPPSSLNCGGVLAARTPALSGRSAGV